MVLVRTNSQSCKTFPMNNYLFVYLLKKESIRKMTKGYWNISLQEMMLAGVHFGHDTKE